jgi:hypothetical protein
MMRPVKTVGGRLAALAIAALGLIPNALGQDSMSVAKGPFDRHVLREIYAVFPRDPTVFHLDSLRKDAFILYGDAVGDLAQIQCVESVAFSIVSGQEEMGSIAVGRCPEHAGRLRALVSKAASGLEETLQALGDIGNRQGVESLRLTAGWFYQETRLPDGSRLSYFPVVVVGHGVAAVMTGVLFGGARPIIVQAWTFPLCDPVRGGAASMVKLCTDTKAGLTDLLLRMR